MSNHDLSILQFQVRVLGKTHTIDLAADTLINPTDISGEFVRQPSLMAWYGVIYEQALSVFRECEAELEIWEAVAGMEVRRTLVPESKVTETLIQEIVHADDEYIQKRQEYETLRNQAELTRRALDAIREKGSALISLGAQMRSELEGLGRAYVSASTKKARDL